MERSTVGAVVLGAGSGTRFRAADPARGSKLLALLDGKSILQHVLDAVRALGTAETVVVLGSDADAIAARLEWRGERRVVNPAPERGLSSSVQVGLSALEAMGARIDGALILLGDQPGVRLATMKTLLAAAERAGDRLLVAPRYERTAAANPVLVLRAGWSLAGELHGDRGFGPLMAARPDLVLEVPMAGTIDDIDTPDDLIVRG